MASDSTRFFGDSRIELRPLTTPDQPLIPARAQRLDVGLDEVDADGVDRQLQ